MKRATILPLALVLLALPLCSGCWLLRALGFPVGDEVPYNPKAESGDISVKRNVQFADLPVPMGFLLRRDESYSFQGSTFRFGRFRYEGVWGMTQTVAFFRSQMPLTHWYPEVDESKGRWQHEFLFAKANERCRVEVEDSTDGIVVKMRLFNAAPQTGEGNLAARSAP